MWIEKVVQLGLPLGNCLLILGLLELTNLFTFFGLDLAKILYFAYGIEYEHGLITGAMIGIEIMTTIYKAGSTCILWIAIFKGHEFILLCWIISVGFFPLFLVITGIIYKIEGHIQWFNVIFTLTTVVLITCYEVVIGHRTYKALIGGEVLQPLGKGIIYTWDYLRSDCQNAAKFFIVAEMVIDVHYMMYRGVFELLYIGDASHPAIVVENLGMTFLRLLMDALGLYLVTKENREKVGWWCLGVGLQILISTGLFVVITTGTRQGEDVIDLVVLFIIFPVHLFFRCVVWYFSCRYARSNFTNQAMI